MRKIFYVPGLISAVKKITQFSQLPKQAYYLIFGFLIFLHFSMLSIKQSFSKNTKFANLKKLTANCH